MNALQVFLPQMSENLSPFFPIAVSAGPGKAVETGPDWINIDEYLRRGRKDGVMYLRVSGDSCVQFGIFDNDLLSVCRGSSAQTGDIVVAEVNGEFTLKKLEDQHRGLRLVPGNDAYESREITPADTFTIWAVVDYVIHRVRRAA